MPASVLEQNGNIVVLAVFVFRDERGLELDDADPDHSNFSALNRLGLRVESTCTEYCIWWHMRWHQSCIGQRAQQMMDWRHECSMITRLDPESVSSLAVQRD